MKIALLAGLSLLVSHAASSAFADPSVDILPAQLTELAGSWRPADNPASRLRVHFSLTAGGTVLVESWEKEGLPHSLTLYHRDGTRLIATHYCPQGNQPRLTAARTSTVRPGEAWSMQFLFRDATDLGGDEAHLHRLRLAQVGADRLSRAESYRHEGKEEEETILELVRVGV